MVMKKFVKYSALAVATMPLLITGCTPQPTPEGQNRAIYKNGVVASVPIKNTYRDPHTGNTVIEKHYIYTPDVNLKEAVVILTKKVEILEQRTAKIAVGKNNYVSSRRRTKSSTTPASKVPQSGTYIAMKDTSIYKGKSKTTPKIATISKGTSVTFEKCDTFGWCTISGQSGYVQAWKFKKEAKQ